MSSLSLVVYDMLCMVFCVLRLSVWTGRSVKGGNVHRYSSGGKGFYDDVNLKYGTVCLYVKWLMVRYVMVSLRFDAGNTYCNCFGDTGNWRFSSMR